MSAKNKRKHRKSQMVTASKDDGTLRLRYDAARPNLRTPRFTLSSKPADKEMEPEERQRIISAMRELQGNFSLGAFLLDKHIQYMATYIFRCVVPENEEFNNNVERLFARWKRRENCDVSGEFGFDELLQLIELHRVTDGDVLVVKNKGGKIQVVEGDRVRNNTISPPYDETWYHGVRVGNKGETLSYAISRRLQDGGFEHDRYVSAKNAWLLAYRRRYDQKRGVSPLSTVINQMAQLYETYDYAAAKERLMQQIGIVTKREHSDPDLTTEENDAKDREFDKKVAEFFGTGVAHIALGREDSLEAVESNNPSGNTQTFWETMTRQILLSLHIPYSFYDGSVTNYYGSEGELNQYLDSCSNRQICMIEWLRELVIWLIEGWYLDGQLKLPIDRETGEEMKVKDNDDLPSFLAEHVGDHINWHNAGMPFWLQLRMAKDANVAFSCGISSPQRYLSQFGQNASEILKEISVMKEQAEKLGLNLSFMNNQIITNL